MNDNPDNGGRDVFVVYDSNDEDARRTCFWQHLDDDQHLDDLSLDYISIAESIENDTNPATELFSWNAVHNVIIINWDAINTDIVYGSRDSLNFFEHYVPDMDRWVQDGNVVLVEEQSAARIPLQDAYDPFTFAEEMSQDYPLSVENVSPHGEDLTRVYRTLKNDDHPAVDGLDQTITLDNASVYREKWFPDRFTKNLASLDDYEASKRQMYVGWFDSYDDAWTPLLFADEERTRPTLLYRFAEGDTAVGAYVVSTMYLSSTEQTKLVQNLYTLAEENGGRTYLRQQEEERRTRRRRWLLWTAAALGGIIFVVALAVAYLLYGITPTGILGAMVTGAVSALVYVFVERRLSET